MVGDVADPDAIHSTIPAVARPIGRHDLRCLPGRSRVKCWIEHRRSSTPILFGSGSAASVLKSAPSRIAVASDVVSSLSRDDSFPDLPRVPKFWIHLGFRLPPQLGPISGIGSPRFSAGRQPRRDPEPQAELRADASFHQNRGPVFAETPPFFWPRRGSAWMGGGPRPHSFGRAQVPRIPGLIGNDAPASPPAS